MIPRSPILLSGGLVFKGDGVAPSCTDILLDGSTITIGQGLARTPETRVISLDGLCVSPGWIDLHTHIFRSAGLFSLDPASIGLASGVTTLVDAGSTGAFQYRTFSENVVRRAEETVLAYVNVANTGIVHGHAGRPGFVGDHFHASLYDPSPAIALLETFADSIVGWKARLSSVLAGHDSKLEHRVLDQLCQLRDLTSLPIMVHHVKSSIPPDNLLDRMTSKDVYTHLYHGCADSIFDTTTGRPSDAAMRARERGVIFDVGHGSGAFSWRCAERACHDHGFWPDAISSDLHRYNNFWPVTDLATTMTKFLYLGAPAAQVIAMVTGNVRKAIDQPIGLLQTGRPADITIFAMEEGSFRLSDAQGEDRISDRRFAPLATIKNGEIRPCSAFPYSPAVTDTFARSIQSAAAF